MALAQAALSGGLLSLSYALHPQAWAAWLAPAPLLAAALAGPPRWAWRLGALAGLLCGVSTFGYYMAVPGLIATVIIGLLHVLLWGGAARLAVSVARRRSPVAAVFVLPMALAGIEALILAVSPHGSAGSLGYSQMEVLPVIQVAALGGLPAMVFVVLLPGSWLGLALAGRLGAPVPGRGLIGAGLAVAVIVTASLGFGVWRLAQPLEGPRTRVALLATDRFAREPKDWARVWAAYGPAAEAVAPRGGVLVLPEKIALLSSAQAEIAADQLADLARRKGVVVVAGLEVREADGTFRNRAFAAGPTGRVETYDKQHLVPGLEARDRPGRDDLLLEVGPLRLGLAICKDLHFPDLGRRYGAKGAGLMLVPAWDFVTDAWLSDRLTALRGVEGGYSIARATREGISSLSDSRGRIFAEALSGPGMTVVTGGLPTGRTPTLYSRIGDLFGWVCLAACTVLIGLRGPSRSGRPS